MTVYADILIAVNIITDYFLLRLTASLSSKSPSLLRITSGAVLGGLFSLWIFADVKGFLLNLAFNIFSAAVLTAVVFGFGNLKVYLRRLFTLFGVSFLYAGAMLLLQNTLSPYGLTVHNSVVYFNISPLYLALFSAVGYLLASLLKGALKKNNTEAEACTVTAVLNKKTVEIKGIIDTGNSLSDPFGLSEIIIVSPEGFAPFKNEENLSRRFRAIPVKTVGGESLLEGYRIDKAVINTSGKRVEISRPVLAISKTDTEEIGAIVRPETVG